MPAESDHQKIEVAIEHFAGAYQALENLQAIENEKPSHERLLPKKGDQKTGLIGEYWAIRYAPLFPAATLEFGGHSQKGWDLKLVADGRPAHYIQIKTASEFGRGKLSPICKPSPLPAAEGGAELPDYWDELWLLWLDRRLQPVVLWKLKPEHVDFKDADCLWNKSLRRNPSKPTTGSNCFDWNHAQAVSDLRERLRPV